MFAQHPVRRGARGARRLRWGRRPAATVVDRRGQQIMQQPVGLRHAGPADTDDRVPHDARRSMPAERAQRDGAVLVVSAGLVSRVRRPGQRAPAFLLQPGRRPGVQVGQHLLADQHGHRDDPVGRHDWQRRARRPQRDPHILMRVVASHPDHRRDQLDQPLPSSIRGAVGS